MFILHCVGIGVVDWTRAVDRRDLHTATAHISRAKGLDRDLAKYYTPIHESILEYAPKNSYLIYLHCYARP
jgi:hypothetical protein